MPGRTGRATLHALAAIADGHAWGWSEELDNNLLFAELHLRECGGHEYPLTPQPSEGPRIWSDSSFEPGLNGPLCRMCAIIAINNVAKGVVWDLPSEWLAVLQPRKTQIAIGEFLAVYLALFYFGDALACAAPISFLDNMGVLFAIVNGASPSRDMASLAFGLHLQMAKLKAHTWFEYVASASNCSDGGSRDGIHCKLAAKLGIELTCKGLPLPPRGFPSSVAQDWLDFWHA